MVTDFDKSNPAVVLVILMSPDPIWIELTRGISASHSGTTLMLAPIRQGGCTSSPTLEGDRLGPTTPAAGSYNLGEMVRGVSPTIPFQRTTVKRNRKKPANQVFKDVTTLHRVKTRISRYLWTATIAVSMRNTSEGTRGERRVSSAEGKGVPRAVLLNCSQALTRMCSTDSPKHFCFASATIVCKAVLFGELAPRM